MDIDTLIATALVSEFAPIARGLGRGGRRHEDYRLHVARIGPRAVAVMQMGIGPARARRAMKWGIEQLSPKRVIVVGVAGGLDPSLARGAIVQPSRLMDEQGKSVDVAPLAEGSVPGAVQGTMLQTHRVIFLTAEKEKLFQATGSIAVDMESLSVAQVCAESGTPCSVVRFISDAAGDALPAEIGELVDEAGNPLFFTALRRILRRPKLLKELLAMERSNKKVALAMQAWGSWLRQQMTRGA